jgi:predicted secreted protein
MPIIVFFLVLYEWGICVSYNEVVFIGFLNDGRVLGFGAYSAITLDNRSTLLFVREKRRVFVRKNVLVGII